MPAIKRSDSSRPNYSSLVPAVEQAARILLALAQDRSGKMTLTEICGTVGIHKSKGYSILNTLQHFDFVQRSPDSKIYSLGAGLLFLSNKVLSTLDFREAVAPILRDLSLETGSTAFLGLISGDHVFVVAKDEGVRDIGVTIRIGHRFPLSWGAHGKCIVAFLPGIEQERILSGPKLYFHGSPSTYDPARLEEELRACREKGFAEDLGGMQAGVHAVASPVFGPGQKLIGSLAVVGTFPVELAARYGARVAEAAQEFSRGIGGLSPVSVRRSGSEKTMVPESLHEQREE